MSLRIKSLFAAFCLSIALWGVIIQGAIVVYDATGDRPDEQITASIPQRPLDGRSNTY